MAKKTQRNPVDLGVVQGELVGGKSEYGPLWEETRKRLNTYEGWAQQGFKLKSRRRRAFELRNLPDLCLHVIDIDNDVQEVDQFTYFKLMIAGAIFMFLQGKEYARKGAPDRLQQLTAQEFVQRAEPHLAKVKEGIEGLRGLLREMRLLDARGDGTKRILKDLEALQALIGDGLYLEVAARERYREPPAKIAQQDLIRAINDIFCKFTNLVVEERAVHIAGLVRHFKLWESGETDNIQRSLAPGRRPKKPKGGSGLYASLLGQSPP